jgi:hypothetical protein
MALKKGVEVKPAKGKLGILLPGMGAVATTFIAGVQAIRRGIGKPIGSLTQLGHIRIGKRTDDNSPAIKDYVSLARLDDIVFGGWDIFPDNAYQAAVRAGVLDAKHLDPLKVELEAIKPMAAVFEQAYVKNLTGPNVKKGASKMHLAEQVMQQMAKFVENGFDLAMREQRGLSIRRRSEVAANQSEMRRARAVGTGRGRRGLDGRLLRLDFVLASKRSPQLRERRFECLHLGVRGP